MERDQQVETSSVAEQDGEAGEDNVSKKNPHKHDSGAADLEKVTDFVEEKELTLQASASAVNIIGERKHKEEQDFAKIIMRKEDIEFLVHEMEISKQMAERKLREHKGNLKDTLMAMLAV